jgi:hypothetical protein
MLLTDGEGVNGGNLTVRWSAVFDPFPGEVIERDETNLLAKNSYKNWTVDDLDLQSIYSLNMSGERE